LTKLYQILIDFNNFYSVVSDGHREFPSKNEKSLPRQGKNSRKSPLAKILDFTVYIQTST